jgi:branched-chain amino acid transport system permease protein
MSDAATARSVSSSRYAILPLIRCYPAWLALAAGLILLPLVFRSGTALTMMSLMGIGTVFALSYNMLLGQTGMLSFGHAVYFGLGAYCAVHVMNGVIAHDLPVPLPAIPLAGGFGGLAIAIPFGWVSTKRTGTAFAMISLGLGELVGSSALILRSFFGGEEGVTTDRTRLLRLFGLNFGQQIEVYYLIAAWCFICMLLMHRFTATPLGRMCNAVRDNAERVQFVGYDPRVVRFLAFCVSGFFAGIAGGLAAVHYEIANAAYFSATQSGNVLIATFIGGGGAFFGPAIGAVLVTYLQVMLSDITEVWQLYFGLLFIVMVMFAPQGFAGLLMMHAPLLGKRALKRVIAAYAIALPPALLMFAGVALAIEMTYRLAVKAAEGPDMKFMTISLSTRDPLAWMCAAALAAGGFELFRRTWSLVASAWTAASASPNLRGERCA